MYQVSRFNAGMHQRKIFNLLDKFIKSCPAKPQLTLDKKDYDHLFALVPKAYRKKPGLKIGYDRRLLVCQ